MGETVESGGRTAVVLGASSPHGAATVRALAREGVNLALGGRDREKLEALEREVETLGGRAIVVGTHLAKRHHPAHLVEAAVETFGRLDALLFMAYATAPPLGSLDIGAWERSLDVNVRGLIYCLAAALPVMIEKGQGHVVVVGVEAPEGVSDPFLSAGRAAVRTILRDLSRDFSSKGIHAAEVRGDTHSLANPKNCADAVIRALNDAMGSTADLRTYQIS